METAAKLDRLREVIRTYESVLVCYSGGIDSALVLKVAHDVLGERAIGMTAVSPSLADEEHEGAVKIAKEIGARHELVQSNEIDDPKYQANGSDRCFHCKSELYRVADRKKVDWKVAVVANGANLDDLGDYRPGLKAASDAGAKSPLIDAGFTKADVRSAAVTLGLSIWDKPAAACLSSRLPYGTSVTRERLGQIAALEAALHRLGLRQVRVRWHALPSTVQGTLESSMARIEVSRDELDRAFTQRDAIVTAGKAAGFAFVTLDLQGYRTGSHNELLAPRALPIIR